MKKIFIYILMFILILTNININIYATDNEGVDDTSPYYIITHLGAFGTLPSIVNANNIDKTIFENAGCSEITGTDRIKKMVPYGMIGMYCNWNANDGTELANILSQVKIANMVGFNGEYMTDSSASRYYLVKHKVRVDKNKLKEGANGDIWYVDNNLDTQSNFIIYDPDLSNKSTDKTFETTAVWAANNLNQRPLLTVNLYNLDGARIDDKMLKKGFYTMEHFLGKKYSSNNGSSLKTISFDDLPLYDLTYFNENNVDIGTFYKYCNGDMYDLNTGGLFNKLFTGETSTKFQYNSTLSVKNKRSRVGICNNGASGLRVNKNDIPGNSLVTPNGSTAFEFGFQSKTGTPYKNKVHCLNGSTSYTCKTDLDKTKSDRVKGEYTAVFEPNLGNGDYAYIKLPNIGIIGNKKVLVGKDYDDYKKYFDGKTVDIYQLVKVSLSYRDKIDELANLSSLLHVSNNKYIDGFDPIDEEWYTLSEHMFGTSDTANKSSTEFLSLYGGKNIGGDGQGNLYIPLSRNASFYNISSPGYTSSEYGDNDKMERRSKSIALTASQGYIQTETSDGHAQTSNNNFAITSYGSVNNSEVNTNSEILVLRNFDADSNYETNDSRRRYDGNLSAKISIKSKLKNPLNELKADISLIGFNSNGKIVKANSCSGNGYKLIDRNTWAIVNRNEDENAIAARCGGDNYGDNKRLSGDALASRDSGENIQQTVSGIIDSQNISDEENNFIITTLFENVNDTNINNTGNYNQINTTSNYLENLTSNLDCSIKISKAFNEDKNIYNDWLKGSNDLSANTAYDFYGDNKVFADTTSVDSGDLFKHGSNNHYLLYNYNFGVANSYDPDDLLYYYQNQTSDDNWLLGEKGIITYTCNSIEKGHILELMFFSDSMSYDEDLEATGNQFSHGKSLITINKDYETYGKGYTNDNLGYTGSTFLTNQQIENGENGMYILNNEDISGKKMTFFYDEYEAGGFNISSDLDKMIDEGKLPKGGIIFNISQLSDGKKGKITAILVDKSSGKTVASKSIFIKAKTKQNTLEYTDVVKNEQTLVTGYPSSDVGFDGTTYGMAISITNTTAMNAEVPAGATSGGTNMFYLASYTKAESATTTFPLFDTLKTSCDANTEYICTDGTKTQQDTNKLFDILNNDGIIKVITNKGGTITEYTAEKGTSPQAGKFIFKKVDNGLAIFLPSDKNYYEANTMYTIQLSIPKGKFVGAGLGEGLTTSDKDAFSIIPTLAYVNGAYGKIWDVGASKMTANNLIENLYYRWKVITPSSDACLQEITAGGDEQYTSRDGKHIYVSEEGAKNNGKHCSDSDVKCLFEFEGVATDSNLHHSISVPYSGFNELSDGDMEIGKKYSLLVKMTTNGISTSTSSKDLEELDILKEPLEMSIDFDYKANMSVEKGITFLAKNLKSYYPMSMTENTSLTDKQFSSPDLYGSKINLYSTDSSTWKIANIEDTRPFADGLKYYNTNLPTPQNKDSNTLYARSSGANGTDEEDRTTYLGVYGKMTGGGKPKADFTVNFGDENVPTVLKNQSCNFSVDFPELEACEVSGPEVSRFEVVTGKIDDYDADNTDDFMYDKSSYMNNINTCGIGNGDSDEFSISRDHYIYDNNNDPTSGIIVTFRVKNPSKCDTGDYTVDNDSAVNVKVNIDNLGRHFKKCVATKGAGSVVKRSNYLEIQDLEIDAGDYVNVEVQCAFSERDDDCGDPVNEIDVDVENSLGSDHTGDTQFRKCIQPTLKLERDATVDDGNSDNDKDAPVYSTAYPFEFSECHEKIENEWIIEYVGGCGVTDSGYKDFKLIWKAGHTIDDTGAGRDFINTVSGETIRGVTPVQSGDEIIWNFNNADLDDILDKSLRATINIKPNYIEDIRFEDSNFRLEVNRPDLINVELDTDTDTTKSGDTYTTRDLSSAIGLNPVISSEKIYDLGLYENPDTKTVIMHKEEIDESSKKGASNGDAYRENVIYEVKVSNPSKNNFYQLGNLEFDLDLNSRQNIFDEVDTTKSNIGTEIYADGGSAGWNNQSITPGGNSNYKGYFKIDKTLNSISDPDYGITGNSTKEGTGTPSLSFDNGISCDYTQPFNQWKVKVIDNPIVINSVEIEDSSPTPDGGNQHLPGDILNFKVEIKNTSSQRDFHDTFIEFEFDDNSAITDTNLKINDLSDIFEFVGGPAGVTDPYLGAPLYDINGGTESCGFIGKKMICIVNATIPKNSTYVANLKVLIKIKQDFYEKLKASTVDEKYWYPIQIKEIRYGTPDLNRITHPTDGDIVYYTSDKDTIPSGDRMGDIIVHDINDPANQIVAPAPDDGLYNFYIGMPYMDIDTQVINTSIGHFSPGDIIEFKTKAWSKSKSYIRDPRIRQQLFRDTLMDFVDVEILKLEYKADKTNFNSMNKIINVHDRNTDTDPTNDISSANITEINLLNDINGNNDIGVYSNIMGLYSDGPVAAYYEGVADPDTETGGEVEIISKVKIIKLKKVKRPQIGCGISGTIGCDRGVDEGTNPKPDYNVGIVDLDSVGIDIDESDEEKYHVYFPILKSILFQQQNSSYIPTPGSNDIKGVINDPNTEVVYRVDNFIPSAYDAEGTGIGKARNPISFIRLPVGVRYTENSAKIIENLSDNAPYGTEVVIGDPITSTKTEYEDDVDDGTNTYDGDIDNEDPDGNLLPTPEEIIEEENGACLYGDGTYGFCILGL